MALSADDLEKHLNGVPASDKTAVLPRLLAAAQAHVERLLGYKLDDTDELPDGAPADLEQAVLLLAADWYENREASISGTIITTIPFSVEEVIREHRRYTFGLCDGG